MQLLSGKIIFVVGGVTSLGQDIVKQLLIAGAEVITSAYDDNETQKLLNYLKDTNTDKLHFVFGHTKTDEDAKALQNSLYNMHTRTIDGLVSAVLGSWWQGVPINSLDIGSMQEFFEEDFLRQFLIIKNFLPLLNPVTGRFIHLNRLAAEEPTPLAAPMGIMSAARHSMVTTLQAELLNTGIRVFELILGPIKTKEIIENNQGSDTWFTSEEVGAYVVKLLTELSKETIHKLAFKRWD
jgi:NAD(P)-dependent dehydrogenase (short-subunit alcohol dehydrogenase family)